jgi:hypothetical protein
MTTSLLTIAEAAQKTGRSPSTIRRLIHTIAESNDHPDRAFLQPTVKQVEAFKKKGENFTWKIAEEVVMKNFESAQLEGKKLKTYAGNDVLQILRGELDLKNHQIEKQLEVIQSLNERLREGNILMGSLQQRLALPEAQSPTEAPMDVTSKDPSTEATHGASTKAAKSAFQKASMKGIQKASTKPPRRGIFGWLLR